MPDTAVPVVTVPTDAPLVRVDRLRAGQFIYLQPEDGAGIRWCQVAGVDPSGEDVLLDYVDPDGEFYSWQLPAARLFRTLDTDPGSIPSEDEIARQLLHRTWPDTEFALSLRSGSLVAAWTDGPRPEQVLTTLLRHGVAHPGFTRRLSGVATATVLVRRARRGELWCPAGNLSHVDLDDFTHDERALGRQLLTLIGQPDFASLGAALLGCGGLPALAALAGVACPEPIEVCFCGEPAVVAVRHVDEDGSVPSCVACLDTLLPDQEMSLL